MKKEEVEDIAYKAMNFPNPGDPKVTVVSDTVANDEVDSSDQHSTMSYCPQYGAKLGR